MSSLESFLSGVVPSTAIILGSGLGDFVNDVTITAKINYSSLDGFESGDVAGHAGELVLCDISNSPCLILSGRRHYYENGNASIMKSPIRLLSECGIKNLILTNAAGSLSESIPTGSIMQITDHINFSGMNPLIGESTDCRFVDMSCAYDTDFIAHFSVCANKLSIELHNGIYMWFSGPSFETPAEIRMARTLGADAVGMSSVPEVILARFYGLRVCGFSVITNMAAGIESIELSHSHTQAMASQGGEVLTKLLLSALADGFPS